MSIPDQSIPDTLPDDPEERRKTLNRQRQARFQEDRRSLTRLEAIGKRAASPLPDEPYQPEERAMVIRLDALLTQAESLADLLHDRLVSRLGSGTDAERAAAEALQTAKARQVRLKPY